MAGTIKIYYPYAYPHSVIYYKVTVGVRVVDVPNLTDVEVYLGTPDGEGGWDWSHMGEATPVIMNGVVPYQYNFRNWDTRSVPNGDYKLLAAARSSSQPDINITRNVRVANPGP